MRHFGILAHSWEGGSACFRSFCQEGFAKLGGFEHPDVTLDCISFGRDAVALVCTEIPLLVTPDASPLPTLDSTHLLARAALDVAVGRRAMPTWRGGPVR